MLTVSAMRADMESMQRHPSSPGPPPHPLQTPPMHTQPMPDTLPSVTQDKGLPSNGLHDPSASSLAYQQQRFHQQQQYDQQQQQQHQQQLLIAAEGVNVSQQHEIEQLRQQLQDAQQVSDDIAAENERLMELSSALRSERDRAVLSQGNAVNAAVNGQLQPQQVPAHPHQSQQLAIAAASQQQHSAIAYSSNHQTMPITLPPAPSLPQQHAAYPQQECYVGYAYPVMQQQQLQHSMQQYVQPQQQHQQPDQQTHAAGVHGQGLEAAGQGSAVQQPLGQGQKAFQSEKQMSQGHSSEDGMSSEVGIAFSGCCLVGKFLNKSLYTALTLSSKAHSAHVSAPPWCLIGHAEAPANSEVWHVDQLRDS